MTFDVAASVGCCKASTKEDCTRPPCPCNMDAWTPAEVKRLEDERRKARLTATDEGQS